MQDDASTGSADRVADGDGTAIDVETFLGNCAKRSRQVKLLSAVLVRLPCGEAAEHLCGKGLVDFPQVDVGQREPLALQDRRCRVHRAKTHLRRVKAGPLTVDDPTERLQIPLVDSGLRRQDEPRRTVGDLRAVARGDTAILAVKERFQLGQPGQARIRTHAIILAVDLTPGVDQRHYLAEMAGGARGDGPLVAADAVLIHLFARDSEAPGEVLGGLSHQQANDRVRQPLEQTDHRRQQLRRAQPDEGADLLADRLRLHHLREPAHHRLGVEQGRMRQRVDATGEDQLRAPVLNVGYCRVERLHAAGAVAHHRPRRHLVTTAETQRDDAADIHFVGRRTRTTENHLVEVIWRESLAYQERASSLYCQIARTEWPRGIAPLEEWRPSAIDDIHGREFHLLSSVCAGQRKTEARKIRASVRS